MFNLSLKGKYTYQDQPLGEVIEAEVWYSKGGANYFSGNSDARGIYFSIRSVTIKDEGTYKSKSFLMFGSGLKKLLLPLERKSDKQLARIAGLLSPRIAEIVELYKTDQRAAFALVKDLTEAPCTTA